MKKNILAILILLISFISCKNKSEDISHLPIYNPKELNIKNFKNVNFNLYSLKVPKEWKKYKTEGIDSFVTRLITSDLSVISSDLGYYSNRLDNEKTTAKYYRLNNKKIKIVIPTEKGKGITGVYIENLWKKEGEMIHFNLYGIDLSEKSEKELLQVISTIEFKEF